MSGIPPGRFIPDNKEDMSGVAVLLLSPSESPPRGIDDAVIKLRCGVRNLDLLDTLFVAASEVPTHDMSCIAKKYQVEEGGVN